MKKNIKTLMLGLFVAVLATGCVGDDDFKLAPFDEARETIFSENFDSVTTDGATLSLTGWTNFNASGSKFFTGEIYGTTKYAEFNPYQSNDLLNVGWLITPSINIDGSSKILTFESALAYIDHAGNTLETFISTNYDGTNVAAATWVPLTATYPLMTDDWFTFVKSGDIDLSAYSGNIHIGFKVTGSGTNGDLDGRWQIDNVQLIK